MEDSIFKPLEEYYDRLKEQDKEVEKADREVKIR